MKRHGMLLVLVIAMVSSFFSLSWSVCPEDALDSGICDTLRVQCLDCIQTGSGPYTVRFPMFVYHDVPDPVRDSIGAFIIPLCVVRTNPSKYCSLSSYWNSAAGTNMWSNTRGIFRDLIISPTDTIHNWMKDLWEEGNGEEWSQIILDLNSKPDSTHFFVAMIPAGTEDRRFEAGDNVLIATMTMRVQDTMHVSLDSCWWPPSSNLAFGRSDPDVGRTYIPRTNLPYTFWIGPSQIRVITPNGGENWVVGTTKDITWVSENFDGPNVKIEYSTNSGGSWLPVVGSTSNTGSYPWIIPSTPSPNCRVKVSDAADGDPYDISDLDFSIILTPYFTMDVNPDTQWVKQGETIGYEVILTSLYGFNQPCTLTVSGIPSLATYEFTPSVVTPTDSSKLIIMIDTLTPFGTYPLTIIGTEKAKLVADTVQAMLYVLSSLNRKPHITVPGPITTYGGLQVSFAVVATDPDTVDTLTLTKSGVGDFPCYPRVSPVVCYFQWTTQSADTLNSPYPVIFAVDDGRDSTDTQTVQITVLPYHVRPSGRPGDVSGDSLITVLDVVFLVNYLFEGGPPPNPPSAGDVNGDCFVGISDILWLINYLFRQGPPPQIRCLPGDFNYDGYVNMWDPPYFIDYMAFGGPSPVSMKSTDVNADCFINPVDLVYEIKFLLRGGDAPQPGCVEPVVGVSRAESPGMAEVGFSKFRYDLVSRTNQMPVYANSDKEIAGVELVVTFDPDLVSLLPPTLTPRTENLGLFYDLQRGKLVIGLVDINGINFIQPGDGPILNLNFVPKDPKTFNTKSIQIEKATCVDIQAQELLEKVVK